MKLITPFRRFTTSTMAPTAMLPVALLTTCRGRYEEKGKKYSVGGLSPKWYLGMSVSNKKKVLYFIPDMGN